MISFCISCAPSFNVEKEQLAIQKTVFEGTDFDKRIDIFYSDQNKIDSLKKMMKEKMPLIETLLNEIKENSPQSTITINTYSSTINIKDRLFRLVNVTESFTIPKKDVTIAYEDFENYLKSNLYDYTVDASAYNVVGKTNFMAIRHKNSWEYFNFNISICYDAYGLKDTKKLVRLYYDEIFEPAKEKWDAETIEDFKKAYSKNKNLPQHKNRDFDAYCDCLIQHEESIDFEKKVDTDYYNSAVHNNNMFMCRILTARE